MGEHETLLSARLALANSQSQPSEAPHLRPQLICFTFFNWRRLNVCSHDRGLVPHAFPYVCMEAAQFVRESQAALQWGLRAATLAMELDEIQYASCGSGTTMMRYPACCSCCFLCSSCGEACQCMDRQSEK